MSQELLCSIYDIAHDKVNHPLMYSKERDGILGLHILQLNSKCQDLPKSQFSVGEGAGGGGSVVVKTQSAKICLNFNFRGRGVVLYQIPEQVFLPI